MRGEIDDGARSFMCRAYCFRDIGQPWLSVDPCQVEYATHHVDRVENIALVNQLPTARS